MRLFYINIKKKDEGFFVFGYFDIFIDVLKDLLWPNKRLRAAKALAR